MRPKNVKYAKYQRKILKANNRTKFEWKSNSLNFGDLGLQAVESGLVKNNQIEAARQVINRKLKRQGQLWIRIFPSISLTKKPIEVRMGKGKGNVDSWGVSVKPGQLLFEITGVPESVAKVALKQGGDKLAIKTQIVYNLYK